MEKNNKKLAGILIVMGLAAACFGLAVSVVLPKRGAKAPVTDRFETVSAADAVNRMARLACGSVSGSDSSFKRSALSVEFVPQEPAYVVRFQGYDGPKADFVPVLMYHFFYDADVDVPTKGNNSHSIQSVRAQLQWLWEEGYVTLTMDELYEWLNGNLEVPAKCVVITSDDGQDNFFELLQPELHKYGFIGTSFVITSYRKNLPYKLTLPNIEMHSHTHNMHKGSVKEGGIPDNRGMMQGVSVKKGVEDLNKSIEKLNGTQYFAYPYGTYGGHSKEILRQAGFRLAFTTRYGVVRRGNDPLQLNRVRVSGSVSVDNFKTMLRYQTVSKKYAE